MIGDVADGKSRYELVHRIGEGAMGIVYRALDRERGDQVALKVLRDIDPAGILQFKREFRVLADIEHPNLVSLYELVAQNDTWFFTMELLEGADFLRHVRPDLEVDAPSTRDTVFPATQPTVTANTVEGGRADQLRAGDARVAANPMSGDEPFVRLRHTAAQLADGIRAIHRAGRLHRDLKPSNVMACSDGRVVILDFGIAMAWRQDATQRSRFAGTPAYMAPEQITGDKLAPASDWYALGVMLFEAITGVRPIAGATQRTLLARKTTADAPPCSSLAPDVPADLDELCARLLARDPSQRPSGEDCLRVLRGESTSRKLPRPHAAPHEVPFVGRERELGVLDHAFGLVTQGAPAMVLIRGEPGMGKSTLIDTFIANLQRHSKCVVLRGRCYERESVPYKAVDGLIDAVSGLLQTLPADAVDALLPERVVALARLFPVLRRAEGIMARAGLESLPADPHEQRRWAAAALREMLRRLGRYGPVVVALDDLQWGDTDSAHLLDAVLQPPQPPPLLFIGAFRDDGAETSPFLAELLPRWPDAPCVSVARLPLSSARDLAHALVGEEAVAEGIAREAGGSPLFVTELVRHLHARRAAGASDTLHGELRLEDVLRERIDALPPASRELLNAVALAGIPITQGVATRAARLETGDRKAIAHLRTARLVRTDGVREHDAIVTLHDRIRETVVSALAPERARQLHLRLALVMEATGTAAPEAVGWHLAAGGDPTRAARHYVAAAERAAETLAFARCAALFARALELHDPGGAEGSGLRSRLAGALANAGRGADAAEVYLQACEHATAADALDYRRRAAEQLLHSGHIEEGRAVLHTVLDAVGVPRPRSPHRVLAGLLYRRALLRVRGLRFRPRDPSQVPAERLARIDATCSAATGFGMFDALRGADFQIRHLLLALDTGEPLRVARALAAECAYRAAEGDAGLQLARRMAARSRELAEQLDDKVTTMWLGAVEPMIAYLSGRFPEARDQAESAIALLTEHSAELWWELTVVQLYQVWSLFYTGDIAGFRETVPRLLAHARERGDLYTAANIGNGLPNMIWLLDDDPDGAARAAELAMSKWSQRSTHLQHYWELLALAHIDLYRDQPSQALARVRDGWSRLQSAMLLRIHFLRLELTCLRARCCIAAAAAGDRSGAALLQQATRDARWLLRQTMSPAAPLAHAILAGVASCTGDLDEARSQLDRAREGFHDNGLKLHVRAVMRQRALLAADAGGAEELAAADAWMRSQGIARPDRIAALLIPTKTS